MCTWMMRVVFNIGEYAAQVERGELVPVKTYDEPADPSFALPPGTRSHMYTYMLQGRALARIHQYVSSSGQASAGYPPDPKWLYIGTGTVHFAHDDREPPCTMCPMWRPVSARIRRLVGIPPQPRRGSRRQ